MPSNGHVRGHVHSRAVKFSATSTPIVKLPLDMTSEIACGSEPPPQKLRTLSDAEQHAANELLARQKAATSSACSQSALCILRDDVGIAMAEANSVETATTARVRVIMVSSQGVRWEIIKHGHLVYPHITSLSAQAQIF